MTVAIPRSLGSKGLKPLVTMTDFATLTQSIKAAALLLAIHENQSSKNTKTNHQTINNSTRFINPKLPARDPES
jgi:hypothetical protein